LKKSKRSRASQQAHPRLAQFPQLARFPMKPLAVVVAMYCSGALAADAADPASGEKIEEVVLWRPEPGGALEGTPNKFVQGGKK